MGLAPGTLPVGESAWGDTMLDLSFLPERTPLVNVLTGESVATDASRHLRLSQAMADFPAALLAYGNPAGRPNPDQTGEIRGKTSS